LNNAWPAGSGHPIKCGMVSSENSSNKRNMTVQLADLELTILSRELGRDSESQERRRRNGGWGKEKLGRDIDETTSDVRSRVQGQKSQTSEIGSKGIGA
jgi:hypothetical protein